MSKYNFFKSIYPYSMELPDLNAMDAHLAEKPWQKILPEQWRCAGFVAPLKSQPDRLVVPLPGNVGYVFAIYLQEKKVAKSALKEQVYELVLAKQTESGRELDGDEIAQIREEFMNNLVTVLPPSNHRVLCFYHATTKTLIISTGSEDMSDACSALILDAVGSIKGQTIYISNLKDGLTHRLTDVVKGEVGENKQFSTFEPAGWCQLEHNKEKATFDLVDIDNVRDEIGSMMDQGFECIGIRLYDTGIAEFKLSKNLKVSGIKFSTNDQYDAAIERNQPRVSEQQQDESDQQFLAESTTQFFIVLGIVDRLCDMFEYKPCENDGGGNDPQLLDSAD